ncbi:MAG TPA: hypothetical protein VIW25_06630 [Nitrososphaeraceae archaeon]
MPPTLQQLEIHTIMIMYTIMWKSTRPLSPEQQVNLVKTRREEARY